MATHTPYLAMLGLKRHVSSVVLLLLAICTAGCLSSNLPPVSAFGAGFTPLADEQELWLQAEAEEELLLASAVVYDDPRLRAYLEDIVRRLNTPGMEANPALDYRVTVLDDPSLNAFAYPHGSIYVHTGLLARMENEDQLATVLAHEMSHVEGRHMVRYQRSAHNRRIGWTVAAVAAAVVVSEAEYDAYSDGDWGRGLRIGLFSELVLGLGLELAVLASVNGYGRDLEREADRSAFAKMSDAGYDLEQAPRVYEALLADYGSTSASEVFFFGSHPRLEERVASAKTWAREYNERSVDNSATKTARAPFGQILAPVLVHDAAANLELGRLGLAESELERALQLVHGDAHAQLLWGKVSLAMADQRAQQQNEAPGVAELRGRAAAALQRAVQLEPSLSAAHGELALLAYEDGEYAGACEAADQFLELQPESLVDLSPEEGASTDPSAQAAGGPDRESIEELRRQLGERGLCAPLSA